MAKNSNFSKISQTEHGLSFSCSPESAGTLPCLYRNNDTETTIQPIQPTSITSCSSENLFTPYHRKQAFTLFSNSHRFVDLVGLDRVGFLTLTFPDNVTDHSEAYRRFKSLNVHFLSVYFGPWLLVKERQKRGAWHYHILIDCKSDIRSGADFDEFSKGNYKSSNENLRGFWSLLRTFLPYYNFGRSELLPIKSNVEGVSRYVGKYITKHVGNRSARDKGVRLFSSSKSNSSSTTKFSWHNENSKEWRRKLKRFVEEYQHANDTDFLKKSFGSRWSYHLRTDILNIDNRLDSMGLNHAKEDF